MAKEAAGFSHMEKESGLLKVLGSRCFEMKYLDIYSSVLHMLWAAL